MTFIARTQSRVNTISKPRIQLWEMAARIRLSPYHVISTTIPIAIILLWQAAASAGYANSALFPSPIACIQAWYEWAFGSNAMSLDDFTGTWGPNVFNSVVRVAQGFFLASAIGIPLGILIGWYRAVATVDTTIQLLRPIPITAWLPFSIALFGIKDASAIFLIGLGAFYPIVVSATQGARQTSETHVRAALMLGAKPFYLLRRVIVPSALPSIFVGLRLAVGASWTAVIIAEMVSVKSGLGYVLWDAYYLGRMDIVLADMASIGALGFLSDYAVLKVGSRLSAGRVR
jgi:NitT/TauT family transport system permease protein